MVKMCVSELSISVMHLFALNGENVCLGTKHLGYAFICAK